jgi:hypothetical protein
MWELICDHRYCWGNVVADRSGYRSDGIATDVQPLPGNEGLQFGTPTSRIQVPQTDVWQTLNGIRIEVVAKLDELNGTLVDGGDSFGFYFGLGYLIAHGYGRDYINDYYGPVPVPLKRWVQLTFEHNGFNAMALFLEGTLLARRSNDDGSTPLIPVSPIPPLRPQGMLIGRNLTDLGLYLRGALESVKIWRIDPRDMDRGFLGRPITPDVTDCWCKFIEKVAVIFQDEDCRGYITSTIAQFHSDFLAALSLRPQAQINEFIALHETYLPLWRAGKIDGPEMKAFALSMRSWLVSHGLLNVNDPRYQQFISNPCVQKLKQDVAPLSCDPQVKALIAAFANI